jgi:hypothetical protein
MPILHEPVHAGEYLLSEANYWISRENVLVASGEVLKPGTVLGMTTAATAVAVADASNTGNGTVGAITLAAGVREGAYRLTILEPGSNAGDFELAGPDGVAVGTGVVGAAFSGGGLSFTLADGSTDFAGGDGFTIYVRAGSVTAGPNTGNGTFTLYQTGQGAQVGSYAVTITAAAANGGTFTVVSPDGVILGTGTVGTRWSNAGLDFLIADGSTDFVVGDSWTVAVARGKVRAWNPANTDGSGGDPYGILIHACDATGGDRRAAAHVKDITYTGRHLSWASGLTAAQKETAKALLLKRGIVEN